MILVPIDISDKEFTERIISHVESDARIDDAEVHFLLSLIHIYAAPRRGRC